MLEAALKSRAGASRSSASNASVEPTNRSAAVPLLFYPPRIGEIWPGQGGRFVGAIRGETGQPDYFLILPAGSEESRAREWGPEGKVDGALSLRDGFANTEAMAKAGSALAQKVRALVIEKHRDFYIASRNEAAVAWAGGREHLPTSGWAWTSTQYERDASWAWYQWFDNGRQSSSHKSDQGRAFVVRRIPIHQFNDSVA